MNSITKKIKSLYTHKSFSQIARERKGGEPLSPKGDCLGRSLQPIHPIQTWASLSRRVEALFLI